MGNPELGQDQNNADWHPPTAEEVRTYRGNYANLQFTIQSIEGRITKVGPKYGKDFTVVAISQEDKERMAPETDKASGDYEEVIHAQMGLLRNIADARNLPDAQKDLAQLDEQYNRTVALFEANLQLDEDAMDTWKLVLQRAKDGTLPEMAK